MKIDFIHVGEKIDCKVTINVPYCGEVVWTFSHQHTDQYYSGLACSAMKQQMGDALAQIRREAYEQGWKEAKAHKGGKTEWFSRWWKA